MSIERYLAKHAIFIKNKEVYAVMGLHEPLDFLVRREQLPAYVKTVLLPFKGRIVYDGLIQTYRIHFGGGIRGDLRETYLAAKQNGRIIESFDPAMRQAPKSKAPRPAKDWRAEVDALRMQAEILRGRRDAAHTSGCLQPGENESGDGASLRAWRGRPGRAMDSHTQG